MSRYRSQFTGAGIKTASAAMALEQIAATKSPFVFNARPTTAYLFAILWQAAGRPGHPTGGKGKSIHPLGGVSIHKIQGIK